MTAQEILKILHKDGWYEVDQDLNNFPLLRTFYERSNNKC